jgi:hypothetical protein
MSSIEQMVEFRPSLASQFPEATEAMYQACSDGAARHTAEGGLFEQLPTDIEAFPAQHVDCQIVPAQPIPILDMAGIGEVLSPGFKDLVEPFTEEQAAVVKMLFEAMKEGYNIAYAVPTHSQVHDIALPAGLLDLALFLRYGIDDPTSRFHVYAKALAWYQAFGLPVPEVARQMANVTFTLPHSRSGDAFDDALQDEFNSRALKQMGSRLDLGGQIITLATGGATNYKQMLGNKIIAECQGAMYEGTVRFLTQSRLLVLPVACYLDEGNVLSVRLGTPDTLTDEAACLDMGIWAAKQYHEMSGIHTFQARTRDQLERFAGEKVHDILEAVRVKRFVAWLNRKGDHLKPSELVELPESADLSPPDSKQTA